MDVEEVAVSYPGYELEAGRARGNVEVEASVEGAAVSGGGAAHLGGRAAANGLFWLGWLAPPLDEGSIFYGPLDRRRGLILEVSTELVVATALVVDGGLDSAWSVTEVASLVLGAVTLAQRLAYQRPTRLSDRLWASERRVLALGGCVELPAIYRAERFDVFDLAITVDVLGRDGLYHGTNAELRAGFFSLHWGPALARTELTLLALDAQINERVLPAEGEEARGGSGYVRVLADVASVSGVRLSPRWQLGARLGVAVNDSTELTLEREHAVDEDAEGDALMSLLWALDFTFSASESAPFVPHWSWARRAHPSNGKGFAVGLLSFERIDPTGLALDVGGQLAAELSWSWGDRWSVGAEGALVVAYRQGHVVGASLPDEVPQVGEVFLMGRLAADLAYRVGSVVWVRASAYAERSDRDDPTLLEPWSSELSWRFGATLGLSVVL